MLKAVGATPFIPLNAMNATEGRIWVGSPDVADALMCLVYR